MRICIPIEDRAAGGLYTFLRYFRAYLGGRGIEHTEDIAGTFDVLFVNSFMVPFEAVRAAQGRLRRLVVVQRVDGSAEDYGRGAADDRRQARVNTVADLTVFQSRYGRYATTRKFRVLARRGVVIPNPVDTRAFTPDGERMPLPGGIRVAHVSFSTNARKGSAAVFRLAASNPDVRFVLAGRYADPPVLPNVMYLGLQDHRLLPAMLRSCDALAFFAENETCPNVVLEAMASGLPVLYLDSGGTSEFVGETGVAVTESTFRPALDTVAAERSEWSRRARERAVRFYAPDVVLPRYEDAIRRARRRRTPVRLRLMWRALCGYPVLGSGSRRRALALAWGRLATRRGGETRAL